MSQTNNEQRLPSSPGTPRWVKLFGIIALILVLLVGVMLLSGGEHGPGRHMPSVSVTEVHTPPVGHPGQHP
jgi:ABC-type transporter Mla subunit MlaD